MYCLPKELFRSGLLHRMRKKVFVKYLSHEDKFRIFERFKQREKKIIAKNFGVTKFGHHLTFGRKKLRHPFCSKIC